MERRVYRAKEPFLTKLNVLDLILYCTWNNVTPTKLARCFVLLAVLLFYMSKTSVNYGAEEPQCNVMYVSKWVGDMYLV